VSPSERERRASLVRAHRARAMAFGWFAAAVFAGIAVLTSGLAVLLWSATHGAAMLLGGLAMGAVVCAVIGRGRGKRCAEEARLQDSTPLAPLLVDEEGGT
jgi:hypothetical protein